jgi:dienelactone hydrolase
MAVAGCPDLRADALATVASMGRLRRGLAAVAAGSLALGAVGPVVTGSAVRQAASIVQLDLVDTGRPTAAGPGVAAAPSRSLPTTVYLPPGDGPAPLIVLAHGAAGAPGKFSDLASAWAGAGYVVAVPRFPLTNEDVQPPVIADVGEQARDVRFVIDAVVARDAPGGELAGRLDPERIGLYGLSLGSLSVWPEALGDPPDLRIDALIQSDGVTFVGDKGAVPFPVLVAHSDVDPVFPYERAVADYDALPAPKYLLTLHGAGHATVGENTVTAADVVYQQVTTVFWDRTLRGRTDEAFPASLEGVATLVEGDVPVHLPGTR